MSTEPLSREPAQSPQAPQCTSCGAPIAADQRYCLECGERLAPISDFLFGGRAAAPPAAPPPSTPQASASPSQRSGLLVLLAGVGVLLLAMGVGVLIGRAGGSHPAPAAIRVITAPGAGAGTATTPEAAFKSDWPAGRSGYTVELRTLPASGTSASAVAAAKSAATARGASAVGALDSSEYTSLPPGDYVVYSGIYAGKGQAQKALADLHKSFPSASVIHVAGGSGGGGDASGTGARSSGPSHVPPSSLSHPAPPSVLKSLNKKGKSYEEASKNLPDVVETG